MIRWHQGRSFLAKTKFFHTVDAVAYSACYSRWGSGEELIVLFFPIVMKFMASGI